MIGSGGSQELEYLFPNLAGSGYEITGEASDQYNCIAWALGITAEKWNSEDPRPTTGRHRCPEITESRL